MSRSIHMRVSGVKGHTASLDGDNVTVRFSTKYVGDFELTMPRSCVDQLVADLKNARPGGDALAQTSSAHSAAQHAPPVNVRLPEKWLVTADHSVRNGIVLLVFDHQTEKQAGFALTPDAAKKIAGGLNQEAAAIAVQRKEPAN